MAELKKFNTKHEIHIKLCLTLAKHGFKFLGTWDLGVVEGFCQECGHLIRYEQNFVDVQTKDEYILGSSCMFKIYILSHWRGQISESDLENKHLQRAGKWLWIIHRDGYLNKMDEMLPQPKDYDNNFKKLADDLKVIVLKIRAEIKREIEEEKRREKSRKLLKEEVEYKKEHEQDILRWIDSHNININKCNDWERNFLETIYKIEIKGLILSEKQNNKFNMIKNEKGIQQVVEINQNFGSIVIVNEVSKKVDYSELNEWEKEFMESITQQVDAGRVLSQKQMEKLDKIDEKLSNGKKIEDYSDYIGKGVKSWLINDLSGIWMSGTVKSVKKETDAAILCNVMVEDGSELILEEVWIPKSQLIDEVNL